MIRKLKSGQYRLYSRKPNPSTGKRRNLGTFGTLERAKKHERPCSTSSGTDTEGTGLNGQSMEMPIGQKRWAIAEGYVPGWSHGPEPELSSHEAVCLLNTSEHDAHVEITVYFSDREPVGPYRIAVPARRTKHVRFNNLTEPAPIPVATEYASVIVSDVPIVVQHTRLDSRQAENALLSTIAYPSRE